MGAENTRSKPVTPWTCPTCNITVATAFCAQCGEKPLDTHSLDLGGVLLLVLDTFTDLDGKFIRTFRTLVNRPGVLTQAYVRGERVRYVGPFALFFLINALFFVTQSLTNVNIFSSPLDSHMNQQDWSVFAHDMVTARLSAKQTTLDLYSPVFNKAVATNAKSLIVLMTVPFMLILPILFYRSRRPFMTHVVFAMHLYTFLLVLFCVMMAIPAVEMLFGGQGLKSARMDTALSVVNLIACAVYLYFAAGRVYGATGAMRLAQIVVLTIAAAAIVVGYRFAIFLITLYTT
jgi:Protein of unknown function (DUF3667)